MRPIAYATEVEVLAELGLSAADTDYTAALIAKAITRSDRMIDRWDTDSNAGTNDKVDASNAYAAGLMIRWINIKKLRGRQSGGLGNQPAQTPDMSAMEKFDIALEIMRPYFSSAIVANSENYTEDSDNLFQ